MFFAVFIVSISGILIVLFSRSLSKPIENLYLASNEIAKGNFETSVDIKSSDEIGFLGKSFNFMVAEIKKYMEEMKEKARLENEIQVAKLVQEQFFPKNSHTSESFSIDAFSTPASECGGDWWGFFEHNSGDITPNFDEWKRTCYCNTIINPDTPYLI